MKYRKGQELASQTVIIAMTIIAVVFIFILMVAGGGQFERDLSTELESDFGQVRKKAIISVTMNDYIWRYQDSDGNYPVKPGRYENRKFNEVLSLYFSTDSALRFGTRTVQRETVKDDLRNYLRYKMDTYLKEGVYPVDYRLRVIEGDGSVGDEVIDVGTLEPAAGKDHLSQVQVGIQDGTTAKVNFWTNGTENLYRLDSDLPDVGSP